MKIIFKSEEEKEIMANRFESMGSCPSILSLKENCAEDCEKCWRMALAEMEVQE